MDFNRYNKQNLDSNAGQSRTWPLSYALPETDKDVWIKKTEILRTETSKWLTLANVFQWNRRNSTGVEYKHETQHDEAHAWGTLEQSYMWVRSGSILQNAKYISRNTP